MSQSPRFSSTFAHPTRSVVWLGACALAICLVQGKALAAGGRDAGLGAWQPLEFLDRISGPHFVLLYIAYLAVFFVIVRLVWRRARLAKGRALLKKWPDASFYSLLPKPHYLSLAYMRGGMAAVIGVALCELVRNDLLEVEGETISAVRPRPAGLTLGAVEKAVLSQCRKKGVLQYVAADASWLVWEAFKPQLRALRRSGLLLAGEDLRNYVIAASGSLVLTVGVGLTRLVPSLSKDYEIAALVWVLMVVATGLSFVTVYCRRSALGDAFLRRLQADYGTMQRRILSGEVSPSAPEVLYAVAVLGGKPLWGTAFGRVADGVIPSTDWRGIAMFGVFWFVLRSFRARFGRGI